MPLSSYYKGRGLEVMHDMIDRYGEKKGKAVFYATANKRKLNPEDVQGAAMTALGGGKHKRRK